MALSTVGATAGAAPVASAAVLGPDLALTYQVLSGPSPTTDDKLVYEGERTVLMRRRAE